LKGEERDEHPEKETARNKNPLLVRRGGCGIKKKTAKPTKAPQAGWSLKTKH